MKLPPLALLLLVSALAAWLIGALYTWFLDPEMKFWTAAARQKVDWVEKMRQKHGYVIGVVGGSTTTFGIDAEYIEKAHGLPVANLGLHAGMGAEACVGFGLSLLRPGDTLILSLEPGALTSTSRDDFTLGRRLALLSRRPEMIDWVGRNAGLTVIEGMASMIPGGYHVITMLGKLATGMPAYRYRIEDLRPGGLQVTEERRDFLGAMDFSSPDEVAPMSASGVTLLRSAQAAADEKGIKLVYVLPWSYWPSDTAHRRRAANGEMLSSVAKHVEVLKEEPMGVHAVAEDFTDSAKHLTAEAAERRSDFLGNALRNSGYSSAKPQESR